MTAALLSRLRREPIPPSMLRWLPGTSRQFGPPRRRRAARTLGSNWQSLGPAPAVRWQPPLCLNAVSPHWLEPEWPEIPAELGVIRDLRARLLAPDTWVVAEPDDFVYDTSFWDLRWTPSAAGRWHRAFRRKRAKTPHRLNGRVLSLASDFCTGGYGHWLTDAIARLELLHRAGVSLDDFDHIVLPTPQTPCTSWLLAQLGLTGDRMHTGPQTNDFEMSALTATTFPGRAATVGPIAADCVRRLFPPRGGRRRIYLVRDGHRRNLVNRDEIYAMLTKLGFEFCRPDSDPSVFERCAEAEIIVSIEGAAAMNALFAAPGTWLVILTPLSMQPLPYMRTLAGAADLRLAFFGADMPDQSLDPTHAAIVADCAALQRGIVQLLEGAGHCA